MRIKATVFLAVLYAVCVLAPHVVLAFSPPLAEHCLTVQESSAGHEHGASSHGEEDKQQSTDGKKAETECCGISSAAALAVENRPAFSTPVIATLSQPAFADRHEGRDLNPGIRPPIS